MKISIESTTKIVQLQVRDVAVPARIWEGQTEDGTPVHCYITRICPSIEEPIPDAIAKKFAAELQECVAPTAAVQTIPLRMIL
jgi:hypothetical protein